MDNCTHSWLCPVCAEPLESKDNVWRCCKAHSFDNAKEGYVNLLLAQHKKSKDPGDSKAMIQARRDFLNADFSAPLAEKLATLIEAHATSIDVLALFDAGCGEGYYLNHVTKKLRNSDIQVEACGIDISKHGIQKAAKAYSNYHFAVASTYKIPLPSESQHAVIQVFAPSKPDEVSRVLKTHGLWVNVGPGSQHLLELKQLIYDEPENHQDDHQMPDFFSSVENHQVSFTFDLETSEQRLALLMMTPFYWTISEEKKANLLNQLQRVTANFTISEYRK